MGKRKANKGWRGILKKAINAINCINMPEQKGTANKIKKVSYSEVDNEFLEELKKLCDTSRIN